LVGLEVAASNAVRCSGCGQPFTADQLAADPRSMVCTHCGRPFQPRRGRQILRRRGTAIVDTPQGILVVAGKRRRFVLPGGGARKGESRKDAAIRELREETGLSARTSTYLFSYNSPRNRRRVRNLHKVFLIEAEGVPKPDNHEVKYMEYWKRGANIHLTDSAKVIIERYLRAYKR